MSGARVGRAVRVMMVVVGIAMVPGADSANAEACPGPLDRPLDGNPACTVIADIGGDMELDAAGNIFVIDNIERTAWKVAPNADGTYTKSPIRFDDRKAQPISGLADAIAVGPDGSLYLSDANGVFRARPQSDGTYRTEDLLDPALKENTDLRANGLAVDPKNGNVYIAAGPVGPERNGYVYLATPPAPSSGTPYYTRSVYIYRGTNCTSERVAINAAGDFADIYCGGAWVTATPFGGTAWTQLQRGSHDRWFNSVTWDDLGNVHVALQSYNSVLNVMRSGDTYVKTSDIEVRRPTAVAGDAQGNAYVVSEYGRVNAQSQYEPASNQLFKLLPYVAVATDKQSIAVGESLQVSVSGMNAFGVFEPSFNRPGTLTGKGIGTVEMAPFVNGVSTTTVTPDQPSKELRITANVDGMPPNVNVKPVQVIGPFGGFAIVANKSVNGVLPDRGIYYIFPTDVAGNGTAYGGRATILADQGAPTFTSRGQGGEPDTELEANGTLDFSDARFFDPWPGVRRVTVGFPEPIRHQTLTVIDQATGISSTSEPFDVRGPLANFTIRVPTRVPVGERSTIRIIPRDAIGQAIPISAASHEITWSDKSGQLSGRPETFRPDPDSKVYTSENRIIWADPFERNVITVEDTTTGVTTSSRPFTILGDPGAQRGRSACRLKKTKKARRACRQRRAKARRG